MLLEKDPCEGCLINIMCKQMCPKIIKFYSKRIKIRSKHEVEQATGYHWEDDYIDSKTGKIINHGGTLQKIKTIKVRNKKDIFIKEKISIIEKFIKSIKFINKGK